MDRVVKAVLLLLLLQVDAWPQAVNDPIAEKVELARSAFEDAKREASSVVEKQLEKQISTAKSRADTEKFQLLESELKEFIENKTLPNSISVKSYETAISRAKRELERKYKECQKEYFAADRSAEAVSLEKELKELLSNQNGNGSGSTNDWIQLFDGRDVTAWRVVGNPAAKWKVENGVLVGRSPTPASMRYTTSPEFNNFHLRVETMPSEGSNGGILLRWTPQGGGVIVQFAGTNGGEQHKTGNIVLSEKLHGSAQTFLDAKEVKHENGKWFVLEIICNGSSMLVKVDGQTVAETDRMGWTRAGHIGLQCRGDSTVRFRKVEVQSITPATRRMK